MRMFVACMRLVAIIRAMAAVFHHAHHHGYATTEKDYGENQGGQRKHDIQHGRLVEAAGRHRHGVTALRRHPVHQGENAFDCQCRNHHREVKRDEEKYRLLPP